jgi:hypothetical protein
VDAAVNWNELGDTLLELASGMVVPVADGVVVTEAELAIPLEVQLGRHDGQLTLFAQPAHSRWRSGFLPPTHMTWLRLGLGSGDGE